MKTVAPHPLLTVVVPIYNEESVLAEFHRRLTAVLEGIDGTCEVVYVNDGSRDGTAALLGRLHRDDPQVAVVNLSRNFGKEIAMTAGLDHARGEAVVVIDSDLQDPPELIPELMVRWREGFDIVYATRASRAGETFLKKHTAHLFYWTMKQISGIQIPPDTGDFRLLSRRAVDALCQLRERHRFMKGLFAWIGYPQTSVQYHRDPRFAGETKFKYWTLWNFAIEGLTSFTTGPLKIASYLGLTSAAAALLYAIWIVYKTLRFGDPVAGYPSVMAAILFFGGMQLATLGIIGEYLGRVFNETKHRPLYIVEAYQAPGQEPSPLPIDSRTDRA
ncbi:MAG TPA: glycosyltransferase family 2 protein [Sedimentisphaerales bacterium]|nr:glycosyltransferase family 2 protein [Sedimentisphaerales bacterium]